MDIGFGHGAGRPRKYNTKKDAELAKMENDLKWRMGNKDYKKEYNKRYYEKKKKEKMNKKKNNNMSKILKSDDEKSETKLKITRDWYRKNDNKERKREYNRMYYLKKKMEKK